MYDCRCYVEGVCTIAVATVIKIAVEGVCTIAVATVMPHIGERATFRSRQQPVVTPSGHAQHKHEQTAKDGSNDERHRRT